MKESKFYLGLIAVVIILAFSVTPSGYLIDFALGIIIITLVSACFATLKTGYKDRIMWILIYTLTSFIVLYAVIPQEHAIKYLFLWIMATLIGYTLGTLYNWKVFVPIETEEYYQ